MTKRKELNHLLPVKITHSNPSKIGIECHETKEIKWISNFIHLIQMLADALKHQIVPSNYNYWYTFFGHKQLIFKQKNMRYPRKFSLSQKQQSFSVFAPKSILLSISSQAITSTTWANSTVFIPMFSNPSIFGERTLGQLLKQSQTEECLTEFRHKYDMISLKTNA